MKKILLSLIKKGKFLVGWSSGKPYDPYYQKRTSAMDDLIKEGKDGAKRRTR